jgi:cytochrome c oxidase assembly protein subunit 11
MRTQHRNALLGTAAAAALFGMLGLSFAAVPLYRMFCAATGYAGTPQVGGEATVAAAGAGSIVVRFNADVDRRLPWQFGPEQRQVEVKLGQEQVAFYTARNEANVPITGRAIYNVTPETVGKYFTKTACFCFNEQTLQPGQEMQFPLSFHVDPAIATDPETRDVHAITLSYTFFRTLDDARRSGALAKAGPHVGPSAEWHPTVVQATAPASPPAAASP